MRLFQIIAILTLFLTFSNGVIEPDDTEYASLDSLISKTALEYLNDNDIKGISIGFVDAGNYRTEKGFGNVDSSTLFPLASITKVITATAIMQLVQNGKLDPEEKLSNYVPEFALKNPCSDSPEITIRHLLTHSSGLSRDVMHLAQSHCPPERREILDYLNNHRQINPAGYRHLYSNPGFELLALVIEEVSGLPYHTYVSKHILKPLMMNNSSFGHRFNGVDLAGAYTMFSDDEYEEMPINYIAAGGLKSNVHEMLHFAEMLLHKSSNSDKMLLDESHLKKMFSRQNSDVLLDTEIMMGVSLFLEDMPFPFTGKLVYHGGGAIFTNTMLLLAPDYGMGVVVLCNTAGSYQMVEQLARNILFKALKIKTGQKPDEQQYQVPERDSRPVSEQQKITGTYIIPDRIIRIKTDNDNIIARVGEDRLPVKFYKNGFFSYYEGLYLKVEKIEEEKILFRLSGETLTPIGKKQRSTRLTAPESWKQATGIYVAVCPCPDGAVIFYESLRIYLRDGHLYLGMLPEQIVRETYGITSEISVLLTPLDDTTAVMQRFGRYGAEPVYLDYIEEIIVFSGLSFAKP